ncbi:MAG: type II secretion system protein GspG [Colwellia sp.]
MKYIKIKRKNSGFTLLELVVVVAVMGLISTMALDVYTEHSNQKRFEATKERLAEIKFAIIGDPRRDLVTGYVVDEGELPENINALMYKEYCSDITYFVQTSCESAAETWSENDNWNGPYLRNRQTNNDGNFVFKDGWGSAFKYEYNSTESNVTIYSIGLDREENPSSVSEYNAQNSYEQDYPRSDSTAPEADPAPLITQSELNQTLKYRSTVHASVTINATAVINESKCLAIRKSEDSLVYTSAPVTVSIVAGSQKQVSFGTLNNDGNRLEKNGLNEYILLDVDSGTCTAVTPAFWTANKRDAFIYRRENESFQLYNL